MRTGSVITEALLGQGEALDCYNQQLQDAAVMAAQLQNQAREAEIARINTRQEADLKRLEQAQELAMEVIKDMREPIERAMYYNKVMRDCCDVAQTGGSCCCGGAVEPVPVEKP